MGPALHRPERYGWRAHNGAVTLGRAWRSFQRRRSGRARPSEGCDLKSDPFAARRRPAAPDRRPRGRPDACSRRRGNCRNPGSCSRRRNCPLPGDLPGCAHQGAMPEIWHRASMPRRLPKPRRLIPTQSTALAACSRRGRPADRRSWRRHIDHAVRMWSLLSATEDQRARHPRSPMNGGR